MSTMLTQLKYTQIVRDIRAILERGREGAQQALQRQILETNWEVGRYLTKNLPLEKPPSANNAKIIRHLARTFNQPDVYFYTVIKLYRYYPKLPGNGSSLTWSHYVVLLTVTDDGERARYERLSLKKGIASRNLYALIANDRANGKTRALTVTKGKQASPGAVTLQVTRGKLYHYLITAPKTDGTNDGTATVDIGFGVFRVVPIPRTSNMRAGYMVRTLPVDGKTPERPKGSRGLALSQFTARMSSAGRHYLYTYKAQVERVIDGDTLACMVDLGLRTGTRQKLRLRGINAPETTTKRGIYVKDHVKKILSGLKFVIVKTYKDDKYGRMLADVFYLENETDAHAVAAEGKYLNQELLDDGLAEIWA